MDSATQPTPVECNFHSKKEDGTKERKTSLGEGNVSPYFKVLRRPSIKDLGISETYSQSRSQTRSNSESSEDIPSQHQNGSEDGEPDPLSDIHPTKPSPPQKPPRVNRRIESSPDLPHPPISERTQSYVSKTKPKSSQRHKPRLLTMHTTPNIMATDKPTTNGTINTNTATGGNNDLGGMGTGLGNTTTTTTRPNRVTSPTGVNSNNPYPWRTGGGMGMGLGGMGTGLGMDFELSVEPRNFSRQPPPPIDDRTPQINGTTHLHDHTPKNMSPNKSPNKSPLHGTQLPFEHDQFNCLDRSMGLHHDDCTTDYSSNSINPSNNTVNRSFIMSGEYDRLETSHPVQRNNISGDFDHLIPVDRANTIKTHAVPSSNTDSSTESDDDGVSVVLPTPLESSQSQPGTPPLTSSPIANRKHKRRKSEDLSELSIAKERYLCASPQAYSPSRRQSAYNSPHIPKRFMPEGIEESSNWQFLPHGDVNKMSSPNNKGRRKRSKWNLFASDGKQKNVLFNPKKPSQIQRYVSHQDVDLNCVNLNGDTPLHCYVKMDKPEKFDIIIAFLVHCKIHNLEIDKKDSQGNTPLHIATMLNDLWIIKVLLSFGANINEHNHAHQTPQDFLSSRDSPEEAHELFMKLYAQPGGGAVSLKPSFLNESLNSIINERYEIEEAEKLGMYLSEERVTAFVFKLEQLLKKEDMVFSLRNRMGQDEGGGRHFSGTFFDPLIARERQDYIIQDWKKTLEFKKGVGSRVLFLDGGGIRGLVQIEVLALIQKITGREVTDLFDWVVGTSTGGIIALAMVYANMTLPELRQLYFQLREDVFCGGIMSAAKRTEALEHILKGIFKDIRMCDRLPSSKCPRVLISAVSTKTNPPQLHFFNNCFNNQYSKEFVWKVARYTSAGPTYFMECNNYVDGGVLANNPCMEAWLEISKYYESQGTRPNFAMAVSIGTGIYPPEQLGEVDFFSKGLLDLRGTLNKARKLIKMLSTALVESERVAEIFSRTCDALDTHFFRFSPALSHPIRPDETDIKVLIDMVVQTQAYLHEQTCKAKFDQMIRLFKHIATISRGLNLNNKP